MALDSVKEFDYLDILNRATGGQEEPYPIYEFGGGRKVYQSNFQPDGVYGKPFPHASDPDLVNNNP